MVESKIIKIMESFQTLKKMSSGDTKKMKCQKNFQTIANKMQLF